MPVEEETTEPSSEEESTTALGETTQLISSTGTTATQTVPVGNDAGQENPSPVGFPWIPVIIAAVVVLAGGGVALWYFVIRPRIGTPPDGEEPPTQGS